VPENAENAAASAGPRSFWSGTIAFGLVSVPVNLFMTSRRRSVSLRMVDPEGQPLARRYVCSADQRRLEPDDIVRGYEIEKDRFIAIGDEELEALAPQQSREIQLERFVPVGEIDPIYFERAYFLAPAEQGARAYSLLARVMEDTGRAGVASFVMRGKQYPVAILAERGILRAETLRFADELRSPEQVGLPAPATADSARVQRIEREIEAAAAETFDPSMLVDTEAEKLLELVERKRKAGEDVVAAPAPVEPDEEDGGGQIVDLMKILKERLQRAEEEAAAPARRDRGESLAELSKAALYERAQQEDVPGRSRMSRDELLAALENRGRRSPDARKGPLRDCGQGEREAGSPRARNRKSR
jgi:DNA end-binding protein Ku